MEGSYSLDIIQVFWILKRRLIPARCILYIPCRKYSYPCAIAGKYRCRCTIPILIIYSLYRRTKRSARRLSRYLSRHLSRRRYVERLRYCGTVTLTRREHIFAAREWRMKTGPPRVVNARRRISNIKYTAYKI